MLWNQPKTKKKKDEDIDVFIYWKQNQKKNPYNKEYVPIKHSVKKGLANIKANPRLQRIGCYAIFNEV